METKMTEDEQAIQQVVASWMQASQSGDTATVLSLMTEDVVFMVPGQEAFGREAFEAAASQPSTARPQIRRDQRHRRDSSPRKLGVHAQSDRSEHCLADRRVDARTGYTLTLFRGEADGRWRLARDANLLMTKN
jgi:uncharacterized protein (TIGR02246 family)